MDQQRQRDVDNQNRGRRGRQSYEKNEEECRTVAGWSGGHVVRPGQMTLKRTYASIAAQNVFECTVPRQLRCMAFEVICR